MNKSISISAYDKRMIGKIIFQAFVSFDLAIIHLTDYSKNYETRFSMHVTNLTLIWLLLLFELTEVKLRTLGNHLNLLYYLKNLSVFINVLDCYLLKLSPYFLYLEHKGSSLTNPLHAGFHEGCTQEKKGSSEDNHISYAYGLKK